MSTRLLCLLLLLVPCSLLAQTKPIDAPTEPVIIGSGDILAPMASDSLPVFYLPEVEVWDRAPSAKDQRRAYRRLVKMDRLRYNIYKVYPLAREAARVMQQVDAEMTRMGKRKDEKEYIRRLEKDLFKKYEQRLKKLSINQGRLLIKLIDRETGENAYNLIKNYKSGSSAVFWQLVAKIFGSNLKDGYDPEENADIERIVREIEAGRDYAYNAMYSSYNVGS